MTPPVVLLHGLATNATRTWVDNGWVDILRDDGHDAVTLDLPGHHPGSSSPDPDAYRGFEDRVLSAFPHGRVDVIGFSLGARTAAVIAARHPDRIRRLVLMGVGDNLFRSEGHGALLADALDVLGAGGTPEPPELASVAHHFAHLATACNVELAALAGVLRRPDAGALRPADLTTIVSPTLVVLGDRDPAGPIEPLLEAIPDSIGRELRNCDHFATVRSMAAIDAALAHLAA